MGDNAWIEQLAHRHEGHKPKYAMVLVPGVAHRFGVTPASD